MPTSVAAALVQIFGDLAPVACAPKMRISTCGGAAGGVGWRAAGSWAPLQLRLNHRAQPPSSALSSRAPSGP